MAAPQPGTAAPRCHKRLGSPRGVPIPSNKRTCKTDMLQGGSLDSEGTPLGATAMAATAIDFITSAAARAAHAAAPPPAAAKTPMPHAHSSAESSSSRLLDAPPTAAAEPAPAPVPEVVAAAAGMAPVVAAALAVDEASMLLPAQYLIELDAANCCLKQLTLPGGIPYSPVHPSCAMLPMCCLFGVPPAAVALGASYFQRLLAGSEGLCRSALQFGFFSFVGDEAMMHVQPSCPDRGLLTILCTCIYLGVKVTEGPLFTRQLSSMLSQMLGAPVPTEKAIDMEMRCLKNLRWRLGPYCCTGSSSAHE